MTDYNDGKWHGWNGGECPVHPESIVETAWRYAEGDLRARRDSCEAGRVVWQGNKHGSIIAFRVVKEYKGGREFWAVPYTYLGGQNDGQRIWTWCAPGQPNAVLFREVIE